MGMTLHGRTLGIIGCGKIGARVANIAKALGMRVIAYNRRGCDPAIAESVGFETLLEEADVVSLHCPLTDETRGMIDENAFRHMKKGAIIINTARGAVIDTDALVQALKSGHIAGAGIDVFPDEPSIPGELLSLDNVVCTPHIGSNTVQTRFDMACACAKRIQDALDGKRPENIVNGL
jgi:glyoxylate reductase